MEYLKARREDLGQVYQLVQDTIQTIYPQYYPHEIVGFFSNLHSKETIAADIDSGYVRVLVSDNCLIGTGTFRETTFQDCLYFLISEEWIWKSDYAMS